MPLVTFKVMPREAMMKENSPICANPIPTRSEVRLSFPATKVPKLQVTILPRTTTRVTIRIGSQCSRSIFGSIIRPIATKKMALNMSRMGSVRISMRPISRASAMTAPMIKAPRATL